MRIGMAVMAGALTLAPAFALTSGVAEAGTAKELACIRIDPAVGQSIAEKTLAAMDGGQPPNLDQELQAITPAARACRARYGWSNSELETAVTYAIAAASRGGADAGLRRNGIDPGKVARAFQGLSPEVRAQFQQDPVPDSAVDAYLRAVAAQKVVVASEQQGQYLGMLAALLAVSEMNQAKFMAE